MGCAKASRLSTDEAEEQLKVSKSQEMNSRSLIEVVVACSQERADDSASQAIVQKLERMEEQLGRLSTLHPSRRRRTRRQPKSASNASLEELETNAREKLAELQRELHSLRSMDG